MPRQGSKRKKAKTHKTVDESERELRKTPRCFVVKRGHVSTNLQHLIHDMREVMSPNCAKSLRESRINRLEDYTAVAGPLHVSHLIVFTQTKAGSYMRLAKLPQGPTLTFRISSYTLSHEVRAAQRRPRCGARDYAVAPLQILNGFGSAAEGSKASPRELLVEMLRGMLPALDVQSFNQVECRRAALFNFDAKEDVVLFRHYHVTQGTTGIDRSVQKLMRFSRLPKLGGKEDIADFVLHGNAASESEAEQAVEAPSAHGGKIAVRLTETGPRMTLQLVKVEEGVCNGGVIYHRFLTKTPSQQQILEAKARERRKLKERNDKLEKAVGLAKAQKRKREEKKQAAARERDGGGDDDDGDEAGKGSRGFHPFGRKGAKPGKEGASEKSRDKGKGGGKGRQQKGKGAGKGKTDKPKKGDGRSRALERFHRSQKKQRTR